MRRLRSLFLFSIAAFAGCTSDGAEPPSLAPFADPEVCDVPCEVVLDSGIVNAESLTFTWDFGDGPVPGEERVLHTFTTAGTYEVTVTATSGGQSTTDTATVQAEPQPKASETLDEAGGTVSLAEATVTLPPDVAPEPVPIELTQLPSMQAAAEHYLRAGRFEALGSAYQVSTPLKTATGMDIAVKHPDAVDVPQEDLAWLVRLVAQPVLRPDEPEVLSRAPLADYVLVPVTEVDEDGTVHGTIFGRQRFQLVTLDEPMIVHSFEIEDTSPATGSSAKSNVTDKALKAPFVIIVFNDDPISSEAYAGDIREGMKKIHQVLIKKKEFVGPQGTLTIVVGEMKNPKTKGQVMTNNHQMIHLNYTMTKTYKIQKVLAHEFFHLIQNLGSNQASVSTSARLLDAWFKEGTAEWACDEVFDDSLDYYHATTWRRFEVPLNQEGYGNANEYRTVGFWKWAESEQPGIIQRTIDEKFLLTHKVTIADGKLHSVETSTQVDYLTPFKTEWPEVDFLEYTHAARYAKDFDTNENKAGELWAPDPYLDAPQTVIVDEDRTGEIEAGVAGDSEDNPLTIPFKLKQHLTADVHLVGSPNLEGDLHVRLPNTGNAPLQAELLILDRETGDVEDVKIAPNLSNGPVDFVSKDFDSDREAALIIVDPRWGYDSADTPINGEVEYWIADPCGPVPAHDVEVTTEAELQNALLTMPAGSVIKLAAGGYSPPAISWPINDLGYDNFEAVALVRDLTLVGAGKGATTLYISGGAPDAYLLTWGDATLRDLTIEVLPDGAIFSENPGTVSMCNIDVNFPANQQTGYQFAPASNGTATLNLYESAITRAPGGSFIATGISINTCWQQDTTNANAVANIYDSRIAGWTRGVQYDTGTLSSCEWTAAVNTDCKGFSNELFNVLEVRHTSDTEGTVHEHCPSP